MCALLPLLREDAPTRIAKRQSKHNEISTHWLPWGASAGCGWVVTAEASLNFCRLGLAGSAHWAAIAGAGRHGGSRLKRVGVSQSASPDTAVLKGEYGYTARGAGKSDRDVQPLRRGAKPLARQATGTATPAGARGVSWRRTTTAGRVDPVLARPAGSAPSPLLPFSLPPSSIQA